MMFNAIDEMGVKNIAFIDHVKNCYSRYLVKRDCDICGVSYLPLSDIGIPYHDLMLL